MYSIVTVHGIAAMIPGLIVALASGVTEEILFRGIIFRITEEKLGSVYALAITAAMFGLIHLGNPNATLWSAFAIAVEAGIMLAAAYMLTRSLWLPIFIHISWNFAESGIFGTALSGMDLPSTFFSAKVLGPPLVTGGAFGPENSVIALGACSIAGAIFLYKARQKNMFIQPFWKAKKLATRVEA
jgi:membrane protease YdiL (CAAX protease family)